MESIRLSVKRDCVRLRLVTRRGYEYITKGTVYT